MDTNHWLMVPLTPQFPLSSTSQVDHTLDGDDSPRLAEQVFRLVRLFPLGITVLYPIVGLATTAGHPNLGHWSQVLAIGALFHLFAHVANDVIDLPLDRTDPRRTRDPLVHGELAPQWAMWIALSSLLLLAVLLVGQPIRASWLMAWAVAALGFYNVAGKTIPIPFVADVVQGTGWASLVLVGAEVGGGITVGTWWAGGFVLGFIAMVNGVHGGLRDVENDRRAGAKTTAVKLGVHLRDGVALPATMIIYASALEAVLGAALVGVLLASRNQGGTWAWTAAVTVTLLAFFASVGLLLTAFQHRPDLGGLMAAGTWHLVVTAFALVVATVWTLGAPLAMFSVAAFVVPPVLYGRIVGGAATPPGTTAGQPVSTDRDRRARLSGLWTMTRIGVPVTSAMLVLVGARLSGTVDWSVVAAMLATGLAVAVSNVFNDRCDVLADRVNGRRRPLVTGAVTENEADRYVLAFSCIAFASAAVLGAVSMVWLAVMLTVGLAYSLFLRRVVPVGQAVIALLFAVPVFYGGIVSGGLNEGHWLAGGLVALFVFARETIKVFSDQVGDKAAGYSTLAIRYGKSGLLTIFRATAAILILVATAIAWYIGTAAYFVASVLFIVAPTLFVVVSLRGDPDAAAIEKATARFGGVFAVGLIPLLLMA